MIKFDCKKFEELSLEELYKIIELRQEVFVVEQNCVYQDLDNKDQDSWHLMGWNDEKQLVAYLRLMPEGLSYADHASIGRVVTAQKVRKQGAGKELMKRALEVAEKLFPKCTLKISAQVYLLKFYNSFGFEAVGAEYLEDGIPHIAMIRKYT